MSIPPMGRIIPPPPKVNKNKLWEIYSKGEVLTPTYNNVISSKIPPPPPKPMESRTMNENGSIETSPTILFCIIALAIITGLVFYYINKLP